MRQRHPDPPKKPVNPGARRRLKLLAAAFLGLVIWAGITVADQTDKINEKETRLKNLEITLDELNRAVNEAKSEIARLNDREYQEERARKELQYARPGELIFDLPEPDLP